MTESILILAAHPDDDILGCGGTIARFSKEGKKIHVAFLADGVFSRGTSQEKFKDELKARRKAAASALSILGVDSVSFNDFPDNRMDSVPLLDIAQVIEVLISKYAPSTVFTHNAADVNVDHQRVHDATVVACRPQPGHPVKTIIRYEVASSTEWQLPGPSEGFVPNWYVDISLTMDLKLRSLAEYEHELRQWPHSRSLKAVEHLARWRGASVGIDAAEAFMLGRHII
jgi:N-acetylglucosamine malate deacetylase 1